MAAVSRPTSSSPGSRGFVVRHGEKGWVVRSERGTVSSHPTMVDAVSLAIALARKAGVDVTLEEGATSRCVYRALHDELPLSRRDTLKP